MKKLILLVAVTLSFVAFVNASIVPENVKQEIVKNINYPEFAKENMVEGDVWVKVSVKENEEVQILEISSTNPELKKHVQRRLHAMTSEKTLADGEKTYVMKVKFELIK